MRMPTIEPGRALVVGTAFLGLGTLDRGSVLLHVRAWASDAAGSAGGSAAGSAIRCSDETIPVAELRPATDVASATTADGLGFGKNPAGSRVLVAFDTALSPYNFGLQAYDPFESIADSLDRATLDGAGIEPSLWAAMEADLFRFAFDPGFTAALESARDTDEWRRFARLNDLYRACVRALTPFGVAPRSWNAWLRREEPARMRSGHSGSLTERALSRGLASVSTALFRLFPAGGLFVAERR